MMIRTITFNGTQGGPAVADAWIRALNAPALTAEKGGFLFKASFDGGHLMLAAVPTLIGGVRSYHYDLHLETEDAFTLIGEVNARGVFTILFKPESSEALALHAAGYIGRFRCLAEFFRDAGYAGRGQLDDVTQGVLSAIGLVPAPETLDALQTMGSRDTY